MRLAGVLIGCVVIAPSAAATIPADSVAVLRLHRRPRPPQPPRDQGARSSAARPADLRHAVQAGGPQRRVLRDVSPQDRLHAADIRAAPPRARAAERRRVQRGRGVGDTRDRIARSGGPRRDRAPGRAALRRRRGAMRRARGDFGADERLRSSGRRLFGEVAWLRRAVPRVRGDDRHDGPRVHGHVLEPRQAVRDLPDRLGRSPTVRAVTPRRGPARVRGPRSASGARVGVRRDIGQGLQRGVHVGAAERAASRCRRAAQRRRVQPQGAVDADRDRARVDGRTGARGGGGDESSAVRTARDAGTDRVCDESPGVRLGLAARGRQPVQRHRRSTTCAA